MRVECKAKVKGSKQFIPETYVVLSQVTLHFEDLQEKRSIVEDETNYTQITVKWVQIHN